MMECVGIDVHSKWQQICHVRHDGCGICTKLVERRVGMEDLVDFFRANIPPGTRVLVEATTNAFTVHELLGEAGYPVTVAESSVVANRNRRDHVNDRIDAYELAKALATNSFREVYVPPKWLRAMRNRVNLYRHADRELTRCCNQLWNMCSQYLRELPDEANRKMVRFYEHLEENDLMPAECRDLFSHMVECLHWAERAKESHRRAMRRAVVDSPDARRLLQIPGVGFTVAYALMARIGTVERFETPQKLAAYLGLNPVTRESGDDGSPRRITNCGHAYTRTLMMQAARAAMRTDTALARWGRRLVLRKENPLHFNQAVCALARHMAEIAWHVLKDHPAPSRECETSLDVKFRTLLCAFTDDEVAERGFECRSDWRVSLVKEIYEKVPEWTKEQLEAREARKKALLLARRAKRAARKKAS